jgi:UDP-glucose:(heptosyl)LPS alpha-1,3-glucosyltransferase
MRHVVIAVRNLAGYGGTVTTVYEHARRLRALGHPVTLYAERLEPARVSASDATAYRAWRFPVGRLLRRRWFAARFERWLRARPDAFVFGHGDVHAQHLLSVHNCVDRLQELLDGRGKTRLEGARAMQAALLSGGRFGHCIVNSRLSGAELARRFALAPGRMTVIHPGYDPQRFCAADRERYREPLRAELGVPPGDLLVGLITSGNFRKRGVDILLAALASLPPAQRRRLHVLLMGNDRLAPHELARVHAAGLQERLHVLACRADVFRYPHALDLFAYPARFEEFGQSVQEAMVCKVPVIVPATVGAAELFGPAMAPLLLERAAPDCLAHLLGEFIARPELRERVAEAGWNAARHNTWQRNFLSTYEVLQAGGLVPERQARVRTPVPLAGLGAAAALARHGG